MAGPTIPDATKAAIDRHARLGANVKGIAAELKINEATVRKYWPADVVNPGRWGHKHAPAEPVARPAPAALPDAAPEAGGPSLPDPVAMSYDPFPIDTPGKWLVLGDVHLPYHDKRTVLEAVADAERQGVAGVLLNGDFLDCYQLSSHYKEPDKGRFADEIECGRRFLEWLRSRFPRARIVYKEGNHDERLRRYLAERAPALFDLPGFDLPGFLDLKGKGVEWVADKRVVQLGRLPVVHGHEFRGGGGVNPARWLFLRAVSTALCGHFHRTSEHYEQGLDRRVHGVWSVGCACYLYPAYDPNNKWNNGWAVVTVENDGYFSVANRKILRDGRVV